MEFTMSQHAQDAAFERQISLAMIDAILIDPVRMPATSRGIRYDGIVPDGRWLTVIVDEMSDPVRVATVWWTQRGR
ncbi:MAG: DUF4258 domain-containing protein [Chloroflexi bacterium]|nr:DUF4258 domain-containing protein [Chloroflexota bacterium]